MIKEIYLQIQDALSNIKENNKNAFEHFDMWNQNVEFLEQDDPFKAPAAFVEFVPFAWETIGNRVQEATIDIRLHIVTKWFGQSAKHSPKQSQMLDYLNLPDQVLNELQSLEIGSIGTLTRISSEINHNHEKYVDSVEVYRLRVRSEEARRTYEPQARPTIKIQTN